jgi:hypothetical protein
LNEWLGLRVNYRFTYRSEDEIRHRIDGNLLLNLKWKSFRFSNRTRLQSEFIETNESNFSELEFRNRIRITYKKIQRINLFGGGEIFIGLGENAQDQNKFRLTWGMDWKLKKRITLRLFYHYQRNLIKDDPKSTHILGIRLKYSL